ncbi:nucleolin-like [Asparagus officinalis]|uniref:nucleolin-like n=1 Tax=Asparagus officinalis TaxID=4686 RepID=UPI00098E2258|nr:nucleolin-like [Asparagus officinalis]
MGYVPGSGMLLAVPELDLVCLSLNVAGCTGAQFSLPVAEPELRTTFVYYRWILAANTPLAKKKLSELGSEVVVRRIVSKKGKEPATSSRKGKQVADSEASDDFETSSEEDENRDEAEADVPLSPVAHRTRRASSPKSPGAPSKGIRMKEKNIPLSSSNKMTVRWPAQEEETEEEEEEVAPLLSRKRSRPTAPSEVQPQPAQGTELRTKFRYESSKVPRDSRASKRIKKTAHRQRQLSPLFEEKFTQDLPVDERAEPEEEGEIVPEPSSPGLMDVDEPSFTEQVHKAMNEEPLDMDIASPPATTSTLPTADTVKLKEVSADSSAADPAIVIEDFSA